MENCFQKFPKFHLKMISFKDLKKILKVFWKSEKLFFQKGFESFKSFKKFFSKLSKIVFFRKVFKNGEFFMNWEASLASAERERKVLRPPGFLHMSEASGKWVPLPKTEFPTTASRRSWATIFRMKYGSSQFIEKKKRKKWISKREMGKRLTQKEPSISNAWQESSRKEN